jgi:Mor family transcriptional regulator
VNRRNPTAGALSQAGRAKVSVEETAGTPPGWVYQPRERKGLPGDTIPIQKAESGHVPATPEPGHVPATGQVNLFSGEVEAPTAHDAGGALSPMLQEVADLIGVGLALKLAEERGGIQLYFPQGARTDTALARIVGHQAARKLVARFGGLTISIPLATAALKAARNRAVREEKAGGAPVSKIARKYHISSRCVWMILEKEK